MTVINRKINHIIFLLLSFFLIFKAEHIAATKVPNSISPKSSYIEINSNLEEILKGEKCPPCFNCNLPNFECTQFSKCNPFTGRCECKAGFGGDDCSIPVCGGLSDGLNRPNRGKNETSCHCKDGWSGINCNLCTKDDVCDSFVPKGLKGTCYKSGILVNQFHQMCDVTNPKIIEILNGKEPQVTFSCDKNSSTCDFQFWIGQLESFYCDLSNCEYNYDLKGNSTHYKCQDVSCKCLPDRMLCGENGSIDISDFLTETIRGPGDFSCDLQSSNCKFSEPSMNDLISSVFGDPNILLNCQSGECLHSSEIPGFEIPDKNKLTLIDLTKILSVFIGCSVVIVLLIQSIKKSPLFYKSGRIVLPDDGNDNSQNFDLILEDYKRAVFSFDNVCYSINGRQILQSTSGVINPGECMAIMGGSGAGKTTLLDILAGKNKSGTSSGNFYINGEQILTKNDLKHFQGCCGFVDQEDFMIPTLTVYETVLNSALLRLPKTMSTNYKISKVIQILSELRILNIKDRLIGSDFERGISGGEKRRVAIACELVTSPSILFLDEPTSGLDGYNAYNVIECLVRLAKDFGRTIIFTIHQPRSNIVALFDKLLVLSEGDVIFSGKMSDCSDFFKNNGYACPIGYNIADYLIDISSSEKIHYLNSNDLEIQENHEDHIHDVPTDTEADPTLEWAHYASHRDDLIKTLKPKRTLSNNINGKNLAKIFRDSSLFEELRSEILQLIENSKNSNSESFFKYDPNKLKPKFFSQLMILCSRTFKNSYRNPKLLLGHYALSLIMGLFCSYLYYNIENNISGFQNRLGLFFFLLTLFGFGTLTGLHSFSAERIVFIRERSNNYYHPLSYYLSKILCDVLPLRMFPPVILLAIIYPLVGLNMDGYKFWFSIIILVLFNLATSVEILIIGILVKEPGSATMIAVLVMLFSLLFAGLFINKETIPSGIAWFEKLSIFHYAYEAISVNEVNGLILKERKYGLDIKVPGAVILSTFGFDVNAVMFDIWWLFGIFAMFLVIGYIGLHYFVYETR